MFQYDQDNVDIIIGCNSNGIKSSTVGTDIFKERQIYKNQTLIYSTLKLFTGLLG